MEVLAHAAACLKALEAQVEHQVGGSRLFGVAPDTPPLISRVAVRRWCTWSASCSQAIFAPRTS